MPKHNSMRKKSIAQKKPPGILAIAIAMKARPVPDKPTVDKPDKSSLRMHGLCDE